MTHPLTPTQQETRVNKNPLYGFGTVNRDAPSVTVVNPPSPGATVFAVLRLVGVVALYVMLATCIAVVVTLATWHGGLP